MLLGFNVDNIAAKWIKRELNASLYIYYIDTMCFMRPDNQVQSRPSLSSCQVDVRICLVWNCCDNGGCGGMWAWSLLTLVPCDSSSVHVCSAFRFSCIGALTGTKELN